MACGAVLALNQRGVAGRWRVNRLCGERFWCRMPLCLGASWCRWHQTPLFTNASISRDNCMPEYRACVSRKALAVPLQQEWHVEAAGRSGNHRQRHHQNDKLESVDLARRRTLDLSALTLKVRSTCQGQTRVEWRCPTLLERWLSRERVFLSGNEHDIPEGRRLCGIRLRPRSPVGHPYVRGFADPEPPAANASHGGDRIRTFVLRRLWYRRRSRPDLGLP